ncbi:MAG: efflux RND transporter periplasmic adaptor subunit [Bacteroidales bacterium]
MKSSGKNKKKLFLVIAALVIIVLLIAIGKNKGKNGISVTVESPVRKTIVETIPANGKIQPVTEVKIAPDVSGEIIVLNYKEGDAVKQGDLIIQIKQDVYISARDRSIASLNAIKAQFLQQKAQLVQIELNYKRNKILFEQKAIAESEYETIFSQYEVAKEQLKAAEYNIKSAEATLKEAEENLVKTNIYAPMTGIISKLSVEKGERVVGTTQMAGTEMFRVANLDEMEVLVDVNENDIIRLRQNDTALIEVDAYPDRKFKGVVTQVANSSKNAGTTVEQVTNFEVKVSIMPESYNDLLEVTPIPFRPGMSASVSIQTESHQNAISIPLQAITVRNGLIDGDTKKSDTDIITQKVFVYNPTTKKVEVRIIKTGLQDMSDIEVTEGLTDSVKIVTAPYSAISKELKNNSIVTINTTTK